MRVASDLTSRCAGQRTVGGKNPELTKLSGRSPDCRTSRIPDFLALGVKDRTGPDFQTLLLSCRKNVVESLANQS
jgi:hypothetical protein